jgi:hypothetical protein
VLRDFRVSIVRVEARLGVEARWGLVSKSTSMILSGVSCLGVEYLLGVLLGVVFRFFGVKGTLMEGNSIRAVIIGGGEKAFGAKISLAVMRGWCLSI